MTWDILPYIAISASSIALIISALSLQRKIASDKHFVELLMREREEELRRLHQEFNQLVKLRTAGHKAVPESQVNLSIGKLNELQSSFIKFSEALNKNDRQYVLNSLNQESIYGRVNYLNKILHLSGFPEDIVVKQKD